MAPTNSILNYRIVRVLGTGGMGRVYLAQHNQIDRKVAIKELKPEFVRDRSIRERFKNEAALMANLSHPNIVALHDYLETTEGVYLVMEYVEGTPLDQYIHQVSGPIPEEKAIAIFVKILDAVHYAHQRNIVHRDIKPANIMLTHTGDIKVLDFGIAKNIIPGNHHLTQTGIRMGTLYYMSPEQVRAQRVDLRSDIYSMGVTLFEMLTGRNPYFQPNLSEYDLAEKIVNDPLPPARTYYPNISDNTQRVLEKATAKNPIDRFPDAISFQDALLGNAEVDFNERVQNDTIEWIIESKKDRENEESEFPSEVPQKETLVFDNTFGMITNRKVRFYRGRDLFESGREEEISLRKLISAEFSTHREYSTGIISLVISFSMLYFYFRLFTVILALFFILFAGLCFSPFPTISLVRSDFKKMKMKGWPWHLRRASRFVKVLRKVLE